MRRRSTRANLVAVSDDSIPVEMEDLEIYRQLFIPDLIPIYGERLSYFIAGPPGCGKSTTTAQILSYFPSQPKYLFTDLETDDRAFGDIKFRKVKMETSILETITLEKLTKDGDCWCVFDDIDKIRDPKKAKVLIALMDNILANGRSHGGYNINCIITSHSLNDYKRTKYAIENCNYWVIFPSKTMKNQITGLLRKNGFESLPIMEFDRVFIHRSSPNFIVTPFSISLLT